MAATHPVSDHVVPGVEPPSVGRLLIDGQWVDAQSGETFDVHDPATGTVIATCAAGAAHDVDLAVRAAPSTPARGRASRPQTAGGCCGGSAT